MSVEVQTDLRELAATVVSALDRLAGDIEALTDSNFHLEWPDEIEKRFAEYAGLKAAMVKARDLLSPEQARECELEFRRVRDGYHETSSMPAMPLLPETRAQLDEALEIIRRARLLDATLDDECRRQEPVW